MSESTSGHGGHGDGHLGHTQNRPSRFWPRRRMRVFGRAPAEARKWYAGAEQVSPGRAPASHPRQPLPPPGTSRRSTSAPPWPERTSCSSAPPASWARWCCPCCCATTRNVGRVYTLVRPGAGNTADERFFDKVAASPAFDPVRAEAVAGRLPRAVPAAEKIVPIPGDIGKPAVQLRPTPSSSEFAERRRPRRHHQLRRPGLVHPAARERAAHQHPRRQERPRGRAPRCARAWSTSPPATWPDAATATCGKTSPMVGYFPRNGEHATTRDFDPAEGEIEDCQRIIEQVRDRRPTTGSTSREFRELAADESLQASSAATPTTRTTLKLAVARERKIWIHERAAPSSAMERADPVGLDQHLHLYQVAWASRSSSTRPIGARGHRAARPSSRASFRYPFSGLERGLQHHRAPGLPGPQGPAPDRRRWPRAPRST